jgi:hypothetical protein
MGILLVFDQSTKRSLTKHHGKLVCRQTRKASLVRREYTLLVFDRSTKRSLTKYHGKLGRYPNRGKSYGTVAGPARYSQCDE